jgi:hypothetical protein
MTIIGDSTNVRGVSRDTTAWNIIYTQCMRLHVLRVYNIDIIYIYIHYHVIHNVFLSVGLVKAWAIPPVEVGGSAPIVLHNPHQGELLTPNAV